MFAMTPTPAPRTEAAVVPIERMLGPKPTAAAAVTPVIPAPAAVTATGTAPPMAMLWAVANKLPATIFPPIPACIPAAAVPDRVLWSVRCFTYLVGRQVGYLVLAYRRWDLQH